MTLFPSTSVSNFPVALPMLEALLTLQLLAPVARPGSSALLPKQKPDSLKEDDKFSTEWSSTSFEILPRSEELGPIEFSEEPFDPELRERMPALLYPEDDLQAGLLGGGGSGENILSSTDARMRGG